MRIELSRPERCCPETHSSKGNLPSKTSVCERFFNVCVFQNRGIYFLFDLDWLNLAIRVNFLAPIWWNGRYPSFLWLPRSLKTSVELKKCVEDYVAHALETEMRLLILPLGAHPHGAGSSRPPVPSNPVSARYRWASRLSKRRSKSAEAQDRLQRRSHTVCTCSPSGVDSRNWWDRYPKRERMLK